MLHHQLVIVLRIRVLLGVLAQVPLVQDAWTRHQLMAPRKDFLAIRVGGSQLEHIGIGLRHGKLGFLSRSSIRRLECTFLNDLHILFAIGRHLQ